MLPRLLYVRPKNDCGAEKRFRRVFLISVECVIFFLFLFLQEKRYCKSGIKPGKYLTGKYYLWAIIRIKTLKVEFKTEHNFQHK